MQEERERGENARGREDGGDKAKDEPFGSSTPIPAKNETR